ncbi:hypothetical protein L2E82_00554 [Cichorium intybus]|uniref:Uncharacterized protein n=1 Tax=Cichorium intybus TaxID=13427 RepID=A0ACB9GY52_CICIN|nr:hypothetical protein L2E82_00554 [Cichorium intybus]
MEQHNKNIVCDLYNALAARDTNTVHRFLAPYIDWWFHGPPGYKNIMQLLTGSCVFGDTEVFKPLVVVGIGSIVVVEGYHIQEKQKTCWVHVWTVDDGKIITQVREYLNTSVNVFCFEKSNNVCLGSPRSPECKNVWQSELADDDLVPHLFLVV